MFLIILLFPLLGSIISGIYGRYLGFNLNRKIVTFTIFISMIFSYILYSEIVFQDKEITLNLLPWINIEYLEVNWAFNLDKLSASMLLPVTTISFLVHIFACSYMKEDPHQSRFFSYLALFTFFMLILVTGDSYLTMFIGWEFVGVTSYLLISFWFTRVAAMKSALSAILLNRMGDTFFIIGMFILVWAFGTLNFSSVFSLPLYINTETLNLIMLCLLIATTAKSAQLGLHSWLLSAMEGQSMAEKKQNIIFIPGLQFFASRILKNNSGETKYSYIEDINIKFINKFNSLKAEIEEITIKNLKFMGDNITNNKSLPLKEEIKKKTLKKIWVYNISSLSLIEGAPFKNKSECAKNLGITRATVRIYLDTKKLYKHKWLFSSTPITIEELKKYTISDKTWEVITGELLGDGHIRYDPSHSPKDHGRLEFTFSSKILYYVEYLKFNVLAEICTKSKPTPWPNPKVTGKEPTQYWFSSLQMECFSKLHLTWYHQINNKNKKKLPDNIENLITNISLAHWIMGDGYYHQKTIFLCSDNFTKEENLKLISIFNNKFGIKSTLYKRNNYNKDNLNIVYRIRISIRSVPLLIKLVQNSPPPLGGN